MKTKYLTNCRITALRWTVFSVLLSFSVASWGQLAAWQFGTPASLGSEVTYNPTTTDSNVSITALSRGTGIDAYTLARGLSSKNWDATSLTSAITYNEYYEFKITVNAGSDGLLSLSTLNAILRRSAYGPNKYIWRYSLDGTIYNSIGTYDSFTSENTEGVQQTTIDLTSIAALQYLQIGQIITIRLYAWDATDTADGTFAIGRTPVLTSTNALSITGKIEKRVDPVVSTQAVTDMITTTAIGHGTISTVGFPLPTASGICFSTHTNPTITDTKLSNTTTITGAFNSYMTNLTPNTTYYARTYVTNSLNTFYGAQVTFSSGNVVSQIKADTTQDFSDATHRIFSATFFKGKSFSLYTKNTSDNLNLGDLTINQPKVNQKSVTVSQDKGWNVTSGGTYSSGTLAVLGDTLYSFWHNESSSEVWYKPFYYVTNKKTAESTMTVGNPIQLKVDLPNSLGAEHFGTYIASTIKGRELYVVVANNSTGVNNLYLIKGVLNPSDTKLTWSYVDKVREGSGNPITVHSTFSGNTDSYDLATIHGSTGTDSLVVGRAYDNKISLYLFRGVNKWVTYEKPVTNDISYCFKMIQGALIGTGVENANALQCIGKNIDTNTFTESFDIDNRKFIGEAPLIQHDGTFAACVNMLSDNITDQYSQYISIITGDLSNYPDVDTYRSNRLMRHTSSLCNAADVIKSPSLRKLATLVGVVEGPPPSILCTQEDYIKSNIKYASPATLTVTKTAIEGNGSSTKITGGLEVGLTLGPVATKASYTYEQESLLITSQATTQIISMASNKISDRDCATLFYSVPSLNMNTFTLCSPIAPFGRVVNKPLITYFTTGNRSDIQLYIPLKDAPFNISEPRKLESWLNRSRFDGEVFGKGGYQGAQAAFNFNAATLGNSFTNTTIRTTNVSNDVSISVEISYDEFGVGASANATGSFSFSKTNTSTMENGYALTYQKYLSTDLPDNQYRNFTAEFALMNDSSDNSIIGNYYSALRAAGYCTATEKPWIITYNVTNIEKYDVPTEIAKTIDENKVFDFKIYKKSESSISLDVNSLANDILTVELYSISGQKVQTLFNQQPISSGTSTLTADCKVSTGIYVVKSRTSNGYKSSLVRL